ncbi:hypothetical protein CKO08_04715 [Halorhodospira halochloris]|nr:hypothetical protein [Halorhodospira halochloris]
MTLRDHPPPASLFAGWDSVAEASPTVDFLFDAIAITWAGLLVFLGKRLRRELWEDLSTSAIAADAHFNSHKLTSFACPSLTGWGSFRGFGEALMQFN